METKINSNDLRVPSGEKVSRSEWPTVVKPFYKSKKGYEKLLGEHVGESSELQRLHYASSRYALLLIFQGMAWGRQRSWGGTCRGSRDPADAQEPSVLPH